MRDQKQAKKKMKPVVRTRVCRSLICVDNEPLLEAERKAFQRRMSDLDEVKRRLEFHQTTDEPQYSIWLHSNFGEQITKVRELFERCEELATLISQVEDEAHWTMRSENEVYSEIQSRRCKDASRAGPIRDESQQYESAYEAADDGENISPEMEEMMRAMFEGMMGASTKKDKKKLEGIFDELMGDFQEQVFGKKSNRSSKGLYDDIHGRKLTNDNQEEEEIKKIYRSLARRLHPDVNLTVSEKQKNIWHEVQMAYSGKDLDKLECKSSNRQAQIFS